MATISNWGEGIILSFAFVLVLGVVIAGFNVLYNKNYNIGLDTSLSNDLKDYMASSQSQIQGGDVQTNNVYGGVTLKQSWGLTTSFVTIIWKFFSGGWIESVATMLHVGESGLIIAYYLRMLWFISVVFAILYGLFKVVM